MGGRVLPDKITIMSQLQQTRTVIVLHEAKRGHLGSQGVSRTIRMAAEAFTYFWIPRRIARHVSFAILAIFGLTISLVAQPYSPPANHRADVILDSGWKFIRQDVAGAQNSNYNDLAWSVINLPHTWNNLDGQDGGNNYYRGIGWYRVHCAVDGSYTNRHFFLKFDGAFLVTDVYLMVITWANTRVGLRRLSLT